MKRLFLAQLEQVLVGNDTVFDGVDPKSPAASGMFSNGLAVLTGNGNFHIVNLSVCGFQKYRPVFMQVLPDRHGETQRGALPSGLPRQAGISTNVYQSC
jgi:hypothetical protein